MKYTVYDTGVVAFSNGMLEGRRPDNLLDRRLKWLEEALSGRRTILYNNKLSKEYEDKIRSTRNDIVEAFLEAIVERGKWEKRSTLPRQKYREALSAGWPSHDQHLLAATLSVSSSTIVVHEDAHARCSAAVRRYFGATVVQT